jgi:soluble lytic murein transglycosylase-like protein
MRSNLPRARILLLALVAALLVVRTPAAEDGAEVEAPVAHAAPAPELPIGRAIAEVNPELSAVQRDRIARAVVRYAHKYELDPSLVAAVLLVESSGRPWARSSKGALGLMQVMPYMMRPLGLVGAPSTIETNVEAGCIILASNIERLGEEDGISAYFWGSDIRGVAYLERVRAARERVRSEIRS